LQNLENKIQDEYIMQGKENIEELTNTDNTAFRSIVLGK
jgi:hypothetical protein